jgi:hypothetical protein
VPDYLKAKQYQLPRTMTDTPFQFAHNTTLDNHRYWAQMKPQVMDTFQVFLNGLYGGPAKQPWWEWYPIKDALERLKEGEVAFVDVGGGAGHVSEGVLKSHPACKGQFVLEDLPEVIGAIKSLDPRIKRTPHDFLKPQPELVHGMSSSSQPRAFSASYVHSDDSRRKILPSVQHPA